MQLRVPSRGICRGIETEAKSRLVIGRVERYSRQFLRQKGFIPGTTCSWRGRLAVVSKDPAYLGYWMFTYGKRTT
jgi:hypothetical protein